MSSTDAERRAMLCDAWWPLAIGIVGGAGGGGTWVVGSGVVGGRSDVATLRPGDAYSALFATQAFATGVATDADSLPVATATRNGADDAAFVLTVAKIATGRYKITGTVPAGYAAGDVVWVSVAATVGGVAGVGVVGGFVVDTKRVSEMAKAGDQMDLVNAPNGTAVGVLQAGLALNATVAKDSTVAKDATVAKPGDAMSLTPTLTAMLTACRAFARGKVTISGDVWTFYDTNGTDVLFTVTVSATGRTVV